MLRVLRRTLVAQPRPLASPCRLASPAAAAVLPRRPSLSRPLGLRQLSAAADDNVIVAETKGAHFLSHPSCPASRPHVPSRSLPDPRALPHRPALARR